jgi:dephospho-CoA kinase
MHIIGLTGGIGSGKSTIARTLVRRGYTVYLCDEEAKRIVVENVEVRAQIEDLLGAEVYANNTYQTSVVLQKIAADRSLLERLNAIIHPAVLEDIRAASKRGKAEDLLFVESAILYESGVAQVCEFVAAVVAPESVRLARVLKRDPNRNEAEVRRCINRQMTDEELVRCADVVLENDGVQSIDLLVDRLLENIHS